MDEKRSVRLRMLGAALRRYRVERDFTLDDAAAMLDCDRSKVSRIETGTRGIRFHDLRDLLAEYGVSEGERAGPMVLAGRRGAGDWDAYADVLPSAAREYLWLEAAASHVCVYEGQRVPALLRAESYARAIAEHDPFVPAGTAGRVADVLAARQRAVLGAEQPELVMVIGEAALRQQVGGAKVMREQIARLARPQRRQRPGHCLGAPVRQRRARGGRQRPGDDFPLRAVARPWRGPPGGPFRRDLP